MKLKALSVLFYIIHKMNNKFIKCHKADTKYFTMASLLTSLYAGASDQTTKMADLDVLFMFEKQNIATKLPQGTSLPLLHERFCQLFGHECGALQIYDKDWSEWVNIPKDFTLTTDRLKLKGVVFHKNVTGSGSIVPKSSKQQATLKSSNACLVVNTDRLITTNPPYFSLLIPNPHSPRLRYYNEITPILYNETSEEFVSAERCRHYVITQRRWRYDTKNLISGFTSFTDNINESDDHSGLKQNVIRYQSVPGNLNSGDLHRCGNTISTLEKKISDGEKIKTQLVEERKTCYSLDMNVLPGGNNTLQFIEQKISALTDSIQKLKQLSGKANEVYNVLCRKFDKTSAEKSEQGRKKRRRKEQNKKKRQKRQRNLEKHTINLLSVILIEPPSTFSLMQEHFEPFITKDSLNHSKLNLDILKPRFHLQPIKQLLEKGCVSKDAEESMKSLMLRLVSKKEERAKKMVKKRRKLARVALNLLCLLTSISQLEIHAKMMNI